MTTIYVFPCQYTKAGVATAPSVAPTITVVDKDNNVLVAAATAVTQLSALNVGAYDYQYTGTAGLVTLATFHTTDLTVDASDLSVIGTPVTFAQGADNNVILSNGTYGNSAIETLLANGTYGLSALETLVAAIKTITDQVRFTVANQVDSNALSGGMSASDLRTAIGMASANMDTQLGGLATPTNITSASGVSLSTAGILAIWNQLTADIGIIANSFGKLLGQFRFTITNQVDANAMTGSAGLSAQQTRDSMKLAPTAGSAATGSIDGLIEAIPTTPAPTTVQIDTELSGSHGGGLWGIGSASSSTIMSQVTANKTGSTVNYVNLVTYNASWSGLTISALWSKIYLTVKSSTAGYQPDSIATLQVMVSNPANGAVDGIARLLANIPTNAQRGYGSLSVDQTNGIVSVSLSDALDLSSVINDTHSYDIKCLLSTGASVVLASSAKFIIQTTETDSIQ